MCGRFEIHSAFKIIAELFGIDDRFFDLQPNYNVAPSQDIVMVVREGDRKALRFCRWGLLPPWAKDPAEGHKMINARAETVAEKPSFRTAFKSHRCLVVADGFFEWRKEGTIKKPVYVRLRSRRPFGFAGLYSVWTDPQGEGICTATIITTDANDLLRPVHDRMPVIVPRDKQDLWLDPRVSDPGLLRPVLTPYPADEMECFAVSPKMNSVKVNLPENIEPFSG
ncbi:MAG: SOS response-associated peptidase [Nitrospirota bacterium]|nr:SOS response-associated peptidase [Nitrospirota bacterium]